MKRKKTQREKPSVEPAEDQEPTLLDALKDFDGMADDLPDDLASNLDDYVHGH